MPGLDDFTLADAPEQGLELGNLNPTIDRMMAGQGQPAPQAAQGGDRRQMLALAALLPILAQRGGRAGVAAFLNGLQQSQARKQQQTRQGQLDTRQQAQTDEATRRWQDDYDLRNRTFNAGQAQRLHDNTLKDTTPIEVSPGASLMTPRGGVLGTAPAQVKANPVNAGSFEDYISRYATSKQMPVEALTPADIEDARKRYQQADDRPRITVNTGGLNPRTQSVVNSQVRTFDSLPVVKTIQKQAEAVSFAQGLDPNTKNPADDQALIYAFAKAMDPDSVVREGEYATVQKYAQSWAQSLGFNAARIFSNSPFLTPEARANMKTTIAARYRAGLGQYQNVRKSFANKINKSTGGTDGEGYLTDYETGFPKTEPATGTAPVGGLGLSYQDYLAQKAPK